MLPYNLHAVLIAALMLPVFGSWRPQGMTDGPAEFKSWRRPPSEPDLEPVEPLTDEEVKKLGHDPEVQMRVEKWQRYQQQINPRTNLDMSYPLHYGRPGQ